MPLHSHLVSVLDEVLPALSTLLATPPGDLFARELVVVPSAGVQQWLTEHLATRLGARAGGADGIVASIDFAFPGALVTRALGGRDSDDPWTVDRLTPTLLDLIAEQPDRISAGRRRDGLLSAARRSADLFDRYHFHRPGMMLRWAAGDPVLHEVAGEPEPPLPASAAWQYALWREARARIGRPSPPERTHAALAELRAGVRQANMPARVCIVGVTALPALHLDVLTALGAHTDVHLWIAHPSPGLLQTTRPRLANVPRQRLAVDKHPARQIARLPQLDSWTRPSQGMQVLLAAAGITPELPGAAAATATTLLQRVQYTLRHDRLPSVTADATAAQDRSLQLHHTHGLARQCEVLREVLLHTFRELPDLDPREVLILAPDIAAVAPHLDGVFPPREPGAAADPLVLPLRVADRTLMQSNEIASLLAQLLALPEGRAGFTELRDLCAVPALQRALGVDEGTVETWFGWAQHLRVRWGLSAAQRAPFGLPADLSDHTWLHALQQLVAGAAMGAALPRPGVIPARGVEIGELPTVASFARLLRVLTDFVGAAASPRPIAEWCDLLLELLELLSKVPSDGSAQRARVLRLLATIRDDAADSSTPVAFHELRALLDPALSGDPARAYLRSGRITATSLVPLRGVPYRVVCIVGLDDGTLNAGDGDGEDLLRTQPLVGDPDPRGEQRQALMEAMLQAKERLIITCTGFDPRSNKPVEPITPLSELLDLVTAVGTTPEQIIVTHPRHAADARNFAPGALLPGQAFGHFEAHRHAAQYLAQQDAPKASSAESAPSDSALPAQPEIPLEDLVLVLNDPLSLYVKRTLGIDVFEDDGDEAPVLPTEMSRRDYAAATGELLDALRTAPADPDLLERAAPAWRERVRRRSVLPPLALGEAALETGKSLISELQRQWNLRGLPMQSGTSLDVRIPLRDGRHVVATLEGVYDDADFHMIHITAARIDERMVLRHLVSTLLLALHRGSTEVRTLALGQNEELPDKTYAVAGSIQPDSSTDVLHEALEDMVALYDEALRAPRPKFGKTAEKLLESPEAALTAFETFCGRSLKPYHAEYRVFGPAPEFDLVFSDEALVPFFTRWLALQKGPVIVGNSRAKTGAWPPKAPAPRAPRKGKSA